MDQPEIVFNALLEPNQQFAESIVPRRRPFDDPAPGRMCSAFRYHFSSLPDVWVIPADVYSGGEGRRVVPLIRAQMLRSEERYLRACHDDGVQRLKPHRDIVAVGCRHHHRQGRPALVCQRVAFGAELATIRGIGAGLRPPKAP